MKIVNGWAFPDEDEFMAGEMNADGTYQKSHLAAAMRHVNYRRLAIDGGAHVGTWSVPMSKAFDHVLAFEPSPDTYECLLRNVHEYGLPNIETRNQALGKEPGHVSMTLGDFQRAIDLHNTGARYVQDGGSIERVTIDSLELEALDFLKLDVEGAEVDALMGAKRTLQRFKPIVLFEDKAFWKRYGYGRKAPHEFLASLGARYIERAIMDEIWGWA